MLMAGAPRIWNFVKTNLIGEKIGRGPVGGCSIFYDFSQQTSSFVRSTAVCSSTFRRDLLLFILNPSRIISAVTALQAAAQLEVSNTCLFGVLRVDHLYLSIDLFVHFFGSPADAAGFVCHA